MWNSAPREKFDLCFPEFFVSINKIFISAGRLGTKLSLRVTKIVRKQSLEVSEASQKQKNVSRDNHLQNIWD